jgi:hypothetical protein
MAIFLNNYFLKFDKFVLIIFIIINLYLYIFSIVKIENSHFYFSLFALLSIINIVKFFFYKSSIFEKFFSFYLWLGFYFFYCIHLLFFKHDYIFSIGNFDVGNATHQKELFIILIIVELAILISSIISSKYIVIKHTYSQDKLWLNKYSNILLFFLASSVLIISFLNINFKFFDYYYFSNAKFIPEIDLFLKWFFLFGFSSFLCLFLNLNWGKNFIIGVFVISCFQEFLFFFSILSRGCIFNSLALLIALFIKNKEMKIMSNKNIGLFFMLISILFVTNFYILIDQRGGSNIQNFKDFRGVLIKSENNKIINKFENTVENAKKWDFIFTSANASDSKKISVKPLSINLIAKDNNGDSLFFELLSKAKLLRIFFSVKNRIFGIDSLMAIVAYDDKGFKLLKDSLEEKFTPGQVSFFDKIRTKNTIEKVNPNNLTMPGIIGFLYYSGSLTFVFISIMIIIFVFNLIEFINIKINNNIFLTCLISQLLAYRLWHFGYTPLNSYKYFISIFFSMFIVYCLQKYLVKYNKL